MNHNTYRAIATLTLITFVAIASMGCNDSVTPTSPGPTALGYQFGAANNLNANDNCDPAGGSTCYPANSGNNGSNGNNGNNTANGTGIGTQGTTAEVLAAMALTLQDEYHAENIYQRVLADFGQVFPFSRIVNAEQRHSAAIARLYRNRSLEVPTSDWNLGNVPRFDSVQAACAAAVQAEIDNIALYDTFLDMELPTDVRNVFTNNRAASLHNHLPAFEACR